MDPSNSEFNILNTYLKYMSDLPYNLKKSEHFDLVKAK